MELVAQGIVKRFGEHLVLDGFTHTFPAGSATCLMGPSGCGKTTLLHILMGLLPPDAGSVHGLEGVRRSAVFQEDRLCENLSAVSNVRLTCPDGLSRSEIIDALTQVGLGASLGQPVRELSGGMRRRVAVVRALLADFGLLFLDEPFKGLDPESRLVTAGLIRRRSAGRTLVMVSHDPAEADLHGARVLAFPF